MKTMRNALPFALLPVALLFLAACSGGSSSASVAPKTSEGYAALGKGDAKTALAKFDEALSGIDASHPEYLRAALGRCEALAKVDGAKAKAAFLDLATKVPAKVGEDDYSLVCARLLESEENTVIAVEVMHEGKQRFPNSKKMEDTLVAVQAAAKRAKTPDALKKLESLGYAGG